MYNAFIMSAVVFDGRKEARKRELLVREAVSALGFTPRVMSVVFDEDVGGQLYTNLKFQAAARVGIEFGRTDVSMRTSLAQLQAVVKQLGEREDVHGLMVQKPTKAQWSSLGTRSLESTARAFEDWWRLLVAEIPSDKDMDCLTRHNLDGVYQGTSAILPATVKAVVLVLELAKPGVKHPGVEWLRGKRGVVVGRSDVVGRPLAAWMEQAGMRVRLCGSQDDLYEAVPKADVVASATGVPSLISAPMVSEGAVVVDVGEPKGDVDFAAVQAKARFITPVPGGVGPMTVVALMENVVEVAGAST